MGRHGVDRLSISLYVPRSYHAAIRQAANLEGMFITTYIRHLISLDLREKGLMPKEPWMFGPSNFTGWPQTGPSELAEKGVTSTESA